MGYIDWCTNLFCGSDVLEKTIGNNFNKQWEIRWNNNDNNNNNSNINNNNNKYIIYPIT